MVNTPSFDENGEKRKRAWSKEEDDKLRAYIRRYGHWNWRLLPKFAGMETIFKFYKLCILIDLDDFLLIHKFIFFRFVKKWEKLQAAMGELSSSRHKTWEFYKRRRRYRRGFT